MKEKLQNLYQAGSLTEDGVLKAVIKGWITVEEASEIIGGEDNTEVVRGAKIKELSAACNAVIVAGVDVEFSSGTEHFNLATEDQSNISNLFNLVILGGAEFPYQADGGSCRVYSASEIVRIYIAAQTLITAQTTYHNELKSYVQTLESAEDIAAITYGMDLPESYAAEMAEKLATAQAQMEAIVAAMSGTES